MSSKIIVEGVPSSKHPLHGVWRQMINRCQRPGIACYKNYGARGIKVCDRWIKSLKNFVEDMGPRPFPGATIERRDNNGNYCPENCRWASQKEQCENKRNNRLITLNGRTKCASAWADELGVPRPRFTSRITLGWDDVSALTTPRLPGGGSKISEKEVRDIRKLCSERRLSQRQIGELFGLTASAISRIKTRSNWTKI